MALALLRLVAVLLVAEPQVVPRMQAQPATGTATIRGVVTDKETSQPLPRAAVTLLIPARNLTRQYVTGADGGYEFTNIPPGPFEVFATGGELRALHLETRYEPAGRGRAEPLKEGEVRSDVNIALARALAISGRVVNDAGEPLARVRVLARPAGSANATMGRIRTTDDRGLFRLFGLGPGRYIICAERPSSPLEAGHERYTETCHPESSPASAEVVALTTTDLDGIEIRMMRSRAFSISGTILDSAGQPIEHGRISLREFMGGGERGTGVTILPGGRFVAKGVTPGEYTISVEIGGPDQPEVARDRERAHVAVDVVDRAVEGLVLTTRKGALVSGRIVYENGPPPPPVAGRPPMTVELARDRESRRRNGVIFVRPAQVRDDLTFTLSEVFGPQRLTVSNPPAGWIVKSIRYGEEDILDLAVEFRTGRNDVEIVLTDKGAVVTGSVTDDRGAPAAGARVILFPADPARRVEDSAWNTTARANKDGRFTCTPRRPGEYLIVSIPASGEPFSEYTREQFDRMAAVAERVTLLEGDRRTIDLRVTTLPEARKAP